MEFGVLGTLEVLDNEGHFVELRGTKLRTLLAVLILRAGHPVSADRLIDVLWADAPPAGAPNALQAQISKLRKLLPDVAIEARDGGYLLAIDAADIDAERFVTLAGKGHEHLVAGRHADAAAVLLDGLALWRGAPLADFEFDEFAQPHRSRLGEMRLAATEDRIDADLACGRHDAVTAELEGLVREHPLRERLWAQLMVALYRCGRQSDSLRSFQRARDVLIDELGIEPGSALRELERQVLAQDPALDAPTVSERTVTRLSNIQPELSTFVGRADDVANIAGLLHHRRLVTITGPGGVGKTRIATELALSEGGRWTGGTWLVELGPETGEDAVAAALLRTFGPRLGQAAGDGSLDWLTAGLRDTLLLIVLDNCEHVVAAAAAAASTILRSCPGVSIVATSREPLGVGGECVRALQPLALDAAVQLFASRAADSTGDFVLDGSSASAVETICTNVDRLPLAIELTAARTRAFSAQQLADLLDRRFGLVSTAGAGRPRRQQTMHAAVDWSFDLLFDDERRLLMRLSVFAGGFTLDAATRVCADDRLASDDVQVLIARLVDKSLVSAEGRSGPAPRFRLLRPVAEYAASRLDETGETATIRASHTRWLIALTDGATAGLRGSGRFEWGHLINAELDNLVRAGAWGLGEGDPADALQIGVNLGWYAFLSANVQRDDRMLAGLLARVSDEPSKLRCRAMMWAGLLSIGGTARRTWAMDAIDVARTASHVGDEHAAGAGIDGVAMTTQAIAMARSLDDRVLLLETLSIGSLHLAAIGSHPDVLHEMNAEAANLADEQGDAWSRAFVGALDGLATYVAGHLELSMVTLRAAIDGLGKLGDDGTSALFEISFSEVAELRGDISAAMSAMSTALDVGRDTGFRSTTILRAVLSWLCGRNGQVDRALELGREVVDLARQPFSPVIRAQALFALGVAETLAGLHEQADEHLTEALDLHEQTAMVRESAMDHRHLGHLRQQCGDRAAALLHFRSGVELAVRVGLPWTVILATRSYASAVVDDDPLLACELLGTTEAVSQIYGYLPTPDERELVDATRAAAAANVGTDAVARATERGSGRPFTTLPALLLS